MAALGPGLPREAGEERPLVEPGPGAVRVVVREATAEPASTPLVVEPVPPAAAPRRDDPPATERAEATAAAASAVAEPAIVAAVEPDGRRTTWTVLEAGPERVRAIRAEPGNPGDGPPGGVADGADPGALGGAIRLSALLGPVRREPDGRQVREVVVAGWRFVVEVDAARRALLRERARRGGEAARHGGPTEVRAVIPGRVVAVAVAEGDVVAAGSDLLVVEAMKMQNEVRSPRDGIVRRVAVGVGQSLELGDLLVVIE